jgi:DNA-binding MarR family transcriptional regulator
MTTHDLDTGHVSRLLRSLEAAGLVDVEQIEANGRVQTARQTDDGWAEFDQWFDEPAASILPRLSAHQPDSLAAVVGEPAPVLVAPRGRGTRDDLSEVLAEMGSRIAEHGCAAEPGVPLLAHALHRTTPVAAAVLASPTEPDVVRARAFLHVARAADRIVEGPSRA